jgi:predicted nucleotidyltransferase
MNLPTFTNFDFDVPKSVILLGYSGSHAYGTNTPASDIDYKGILVPPKDYYYSPFRNVEQVGWKLKDGTHHVGAHVSTISGAEEEGTIYALSKFMKLASACNPNVVELLFTDTKQLVHASVAGVILLENRRKFLSQRAGKTFTGYAMSQLKRIETHRRWITTPPTHRPERSEFDLPPVEQINPDQLNAVRAFVRRNMHTMAPWLLDADNQHKEAFWEGVCNLMALYTDNPDAEYDENRDNWMTIEEQYAEKTSASMSFDTNFIEYLKQEKKFSQAKSDWDKYQNWLVTRNPARADLEARYGYDCKHAMHLVRLLRMGNEVLTEGQLHVYRQDREELNKIRNGHWDFDYLLKWSREQVDVIYDLLRSGKCVLPKDPDQKKLEEINEEVIAAHWGLQ